MPHISSPTELCTVVVTVTAPANIIDEMQPHAHSGLGRFAAMRGFVAGALHRSTDGARLVQYLQWQSEADYLAAMSDPIWETLSSTRPFMAHIESGAAELDARIYDVVAARE